MSPLSGKKQNFYFILLGNLANCSVIEGHLDIPESTLKANFLVPRLFFDIELHLIFTLYFGFFQKMDKHFLNNRMLA